jgi:hypothetical protein
MRALRGVGLRVIVTLALLAAVLTACSRDSDSSLPTPSRAFCQAAYDYDTNLPKLIGKIRQQTELVQKLADHAPKDIAADAQTYLDAMKRRANGDKSVVDNPKVEKAVDNVNRRAAAGCKLYEQNNDAGGGI